MSILGTGVWSIVPILQSCGLDYAINGRPLAHRRRKDKNRISTAPSIRTKNQAFKDCLYDLIKKALKGNQENLRDSIKQIIGIIVGLLKDLVTPTMNPKTKGVVYKQKIDRQFHFMYSGKCKIYLSDQEYKTHNRKKYLERLIFYVKLRASNSFTGILEVVRKTFLQITSHTFPFRST
ncbi:hypothetical protein Glove_140g35 [Diversispora epigaea]|uniref:Uncharacterized protein n=1 Tax=Diversispora epigaea TaxID=1348612 RepID=A0A397J3X9_9GLOM|nr:hypothetical protein Glove_140g35 [Diversispora epigaea]